MLVSDSRVQETREPQYGTQGQRSNLETLMTHAAMRDIMT